MLPAERRFYSIAAPAEIGVLHEHAPVAIGAAEAPNRSGGRAQTPRREVR
jgi:hypothetical protein